GQHTVRQHATPHLRDLVRGIASYHAAHGSNSATTVSTASPERRKFRRLASEWMLPYYAGGRRYSVSTVRSTDHNQGPRLRPWSYPRSAGCHRQPGGPGDFDRRVDVAIQPRPALLALPGAVVQRLAAVPRRRHAHDANVGRRKHLGAINSSAAASYRAAEP